MPRLRALVLAALLALATGCSHTPPNYALKGDPCGAVPLDTFEKLSGGPPTAQDPSKVTQGLQGGYCQVEFVKLAAFIAIHPSGPDAAKAMYQEFRTHDAAHVNDGAVVADVPDLGSEAYMERQRLTGGNGPWVPTDNSLYRYGVQDGNLVLTVTFSGFSRAGSDWPTREQDLQDDVRSAVDQILEALSG